ncbi:MAG: nucleoside 2-deoxyribosyltransferase [Enterobacterales bacterium]|jgi:nucleoside 2-deoxyribosyltransferase
MSDVFKFQDQEFETKQELFTHLRDNHDRLIANKKAIIKTTDTVEVSDFTSNQAKDSATKLEASYSWMKEGYVYPIINTTNYFDSHSDVHSDAIWNKSAKDKNGLIVWDSNHELKIGSEVAFAPDVNIVLKSLKFSDIGYDSPKTTNALIFEVAKVNIVNSSVVNRIDKNIPTQHSVRMRYVKIEFAMNSDEKGDEKYLANYNKYIKTIANQDKAEAQGYYWIVLEAEIVAEGSSVVNGSNDITPMLIGKNIQPLKDTDKEPLKDTQTKVTARRSDITQFYQNLL